MAVTTLIATADAIRAFGIDTTQTALGRLPSSVDDTESEGQGLQLGKPEFHRVARLMQEAEKSSAARKPFRLSARINGSKIAHAVSVKCIRDDGQDADDLNATREYQTDIKSANGHCTSMFVRLQCDQNGAYWLNNRANPSSLLNGYNAFGVALGGYEPAEERARLLRTPFNLLRRLLREVDPKFGWERETSRRIKNLLFKACPIQVFTYMDTAPIAPDQWLGFLRVVLGCPLGNGEGHYCLLTDLLGIEVDAKLAGGPVQSLLIKFRTNGRIVLSVNLYDKNAAATGEAAMTGAQVGDAKTREFLRQHVRVDVTLHDGALRDLIGEAKLGNKDKAVLTAAAFNEAVGVLDAGKGKSGRRFVSWLLYYIFDQRLSLLRLLNYRPSLVDKTRTVLAGYNPVAVKVFDEWREHGFRFQPGGHGTVSFDQFAMNWARSPVDRPIARTMRRKARETGLDLDIPLAAYDALFTMRHYFDLVAKDRAALAVALEVEDRKAIARLMDRSRGNSTVTMRKIGQMFVKMIEGAHVPAATLPPPGPVE